jgi:hypothetical protein
MLRPVALVGIDVSGERIASIIRVTTIGELLCCSQLADSCHPDGEGDTVLRNVISYKSPMV